MAQSTYESKALWNRNLKFYTDAWVSIAYAVRHLLKSCFKPDRLTELLLGKLLMVASEAVQSDINVNSSLSRLKCCREKKLDTENLLYHSHTILQAFHYLYCDVEFEGQVHYSRNAWK